MISDYWIGTLLVSLGVLIFSDAPFSVLVYALYAGQSDSAQTWGIATLMLLVAQLGYTIKRRVSSD